MNDARRTLTSHDEVLEAIAAEIDIPHHLEKLARARYRSVGDWLEREESELRYNEPEIYPQGSFLLGTVIRPLRKGEAFDMDLVCNLKAADKATYGSMKGLKEAVGRELTRYAEDKGMKSLPEPKRRCWTFTYADEVSFHMDVLPAVPNEASYRALLEAREFHDLVGDSSMTREAIAITDNTLSGYPLPGYGDWPISNPKGYAIWFGRRQGEVLRRRKQNLFETLAARGEALYASVEEVPDYEVKTPLQRAVQLLKRHRDVMFGDDEDKPISIVITTLAAKAYQGEESLGQALRTILRGMADHIETRFNADQGREERWVANPVNPTENYADKWPDVPKKEKNFYAWLEAAQRHFGAYLRGARYDAVPQELREALSAPTVDKVLPLIAAAAPAEARDVRLESEIAKVQEEGRATKPWSA